MNLSDFFRKLTTNPELIEFNETMAVISAHYCYQPCQFRNGDLHNEAGSNEGSCKIFAFGQLNDLSEQATLACFGQYYREDVLQNPQGDDHGNIRNFMEHGWQGIHFEGVALV